jgi:hypothetical protein
MPYEIKYDAETECLMCHMSGEFHTTELPEFASKVVALLDKHSCVRILSDLREVDLRLSMGDLYYIPKLVTEAGVKHNVKRAIVFSKDAEYYEFLKTVSDNRGQFVRVFTDFDEAQTWIKEDEVS